MTKTQRAVIEEVIRKAENGPSLPFLDGSRPDAEQQARSWAQTWIETPLRELLRNVDGEISAVSLKNWTR